MPRLAPLHPDQVQELAHIFTQTEQLMGFVPNDGLLMARRPDITRALLNLVQAIYAPGKVDNGLKRLIGELTSKAAGCAYCEAHAAHSAHKLGVAEEKIQAVWEFHSSPLFSDKEKSALNIALKAGMVPNATTDQDFEDLKTHYGDEEIVEIVSVIALFGFLNRWNSTLATELETMPSALVKNLKLKENHNAET